MPLTAGNSEPLRYERKFLITGHSHSEVEQIVKFHPSCFSEIFQERSVNNIYFDSLGLNSYYDNVEGQERRTKVRIRWYGEMFGDIKDPVLEYKIKTGLLGKKESFVLKSFVLDTGFEKERIENAISAENLPEHVRIELISLKPVLLNCYKRKYFLSADKNFRITIDHHLVFHKISYLENTFANRSVDHRTTILELKYDSSLETEAGDVTTYLPFSLTKSSKYLQGLERVIL